MKQEIDIFTVEKVMDIFKYYGSFSYYEFSKKNGYQPEKYTHVERKIKRAIRKGQTITSADEINLIRENKKEGISACITLGLIETEAQLYEYLVTYGLEDLAQEFNLPNRKASYTKRI